MRAALSPATTTLSSIPARTLANAIRALSMDAVEKAASGHPGMPMGMADVATVLFTRFLKFDPTQPLWPNRDRFVLSAGHGSMLIYSLLYLTGYPDMTLEELKNFRQWGAKTAGHPEFGHATGIETTTGPLGQGIANAVGMAIAERHLAARFDESVMDHFTYVIAGDGCLMEGISQEAISLAGHLKLNKLIVLWDDNKISIDGPTSLSTSEDMPARFRACHWDVQAIDGHDPEAIAAAIAKAQTTDTPSLIACRTTIAYGAPTKAGSEKSHGSPLGAEEIKGTREALSWSHAPFEIPAEVLAAWRETGAKGKALYQEWQSKFAALPADTQATFKRAFAGELPQGWEKAITELKQQLAATPAKEATRKSSEHTLARLVPAIPELLGGSADLTGSNNTKVGGMKALNAENYGGNYLYYGIREHGMAAAMNGLALHGGIIPYSGTFLVFTDYCRPAIRLSALMQQRVIYVMTHDSIGLGEDGPTHQPVEHLAALRAIPNLLVFRPCDAVETAECWQLALEAQSSPSILALSRQNVPQLRTEFTAENRSAKGSYILSAAAQKATVTLIATGTEVQLAITAQQQLAGKGIHADVVSMPSWELFNQQDTAYKTSVLPTHTRKIAIEAALRFGWDHYIGMDGHFIGMEGFGASAPAEILYKEFGITVEHIVQAAS